MVIFCGFAFYAGLELALGDAEDDAHTELVDRCSNRGGVRGWRWWRGRRRGRELAASVGM